MKVEHISTLYKCPLCSRYVRARLRANGCLQVSLTPKFVQRRRVVEVCSKYVDARSTSTAGVDAGCTRSTAVCFAWSHDLYRSATVTFTVYLCLAGTVKPYTSPAQNFFGGGRLRLAGRPLDSLNGLHTPPRPYLREYRARCSAASDNLTSCSTGWEAAHRPMQGIAL